MALKKRLLFFDFITHYGGAQKSTVLLCKQLRDRYDIQIADAYGYCMPYLDELTANGLPVHILMQRSKDVVIGHSDRRLLRLLTLLRQIPHLLVMIKELISTINYLEPQLIWTNNIKAFFFLSICSYFNRSILGIYAHGWYHKSQISWWQRLLVRKYADIVFAVSNPTKKAMVEWGVADEKIMVVYTAVDMEAMRRSALKSGRPNIEIPNIFIILVPGTLLFTKGQHTILEAAEKLKQKGINFEVWFAGDIGVGDRSGYYEGLKRKAMESGIQENIRFLGWCDNLPYLMSKANVVVLPTHTEGFPMVVQEALLLKRPVITTPVGGIPDLIEDGMSGFLIEVGDSAALTEKIEWVFKNPEQAAQVANEGHQRYLRLMDGNLQLSLFCRAADRAIS